MYLRELSGSKFHSVTRSYVILYNDDRNSIFINSAFIWFWNWALQLYNSRLHWVPDRLIGLVTDVEPFPLDLDDIALLDCCQFWVSQQSWFFLHSRKNGTYWNWRNKTSIHSPHKIIHSQWCCHKWKKKKKKKKKKKNIYYKERAIMFTTHIYFHADSQNTQSQTKNKLSIGKR